MRFLIKLLVVFLFFITFNAACKKEGNDKKTNGNSVLTLSKSSVKRGEQLLASTNLADANSKIRWTIFPSGSSTISSANKQAAAIFAFAGAYRITASYYSLSDTSVAYDSSSSPVTVTDSFYTPGSDGTNVDTALLADAGDQIILSPVMASDSILVMLAQTINLYNCTPYLTAYAAGGTISSSLLFDFNWGEVVEGKVDCNGAKNPAIAYIFLYSAANGTYNISAAINQTTYTGSLTVTDTDYTFGWNYTSGILISPLQIKKR